MMKGMERLSDSIARLMAGREGASAIEYAFIAALICVVIIFSVREVGVEVGSLFNTAVEAFPDG